MYKNLLVYKANEELKKKIAELLGTEDENKLKGLCDEIRDYMGRLEVSRYSEKDPVVQELKVSMVKDLVVVECVTEEASMKMVFDWYAKITGTNGLMVVWENDDVRAYVCEYITRCDIQDKRKEQSKRLAKYLDYGNIVRNKQAVTKLSCFVNEYKTLEKYNMGR